MTKKQFLKLFDLISNDEERDEFLKDERIKPERRLHSRCDMNAFLLLDSLSTRKAGKRMDIVCRADYDEIWLEITPGDVAKNATEEDIADLIRCGVRMDDDDETFCMFV